MHPVEISKAGTRPPQLALLMGRSSGCVIKTPPAILRELAIAGGGASGRESRIERPSHEQLC
jgi:hypothetical protein